MVQYSTVSYMPVASAFNDIVNSLGGRVVGVANGFLKEMARHASMSALNVCVIGRACDVQADTGQPMCWWGPTYLFGVESLSCEGYDASC